MAHESVHESPFESPTRLMLGELGPILRAADTAIPAERIASNGAAVKAAIAAGLSSSFPLWKLIVPLLLVVGVGIAIVVPRLGSDEVTPPAPVVAPAPAPTPPIDAAPIVVEPPDAEVVAAIADAAPPRTLPRVAHATPVDAGILDAPAPTSDLPAQIELYEAARTAAARGDVAGGLAKLDELLARFPATPLRAEAELTRGELLARTDRHGDAAAALGALANDPAHRGRRGELLRALGDVRRKQGDCARAVDAYTQARAAGVNAGELAKIERGIAACAPR